MLSIHSQLLYVVCRPVYVLLTRLTREQINSFKRDTQKCQYLGQNASVNGTESKIETPERSRPHISLKRKSPCDETDANVPDKYKRIVNSNTTLRDSSVFEVTRPSDKNPTTIKTKEKSLCPKVSDTVTMIDLCSSDEETCSHATMSSDENRDPMNYIANDMTKSLLQRLSSTKLHVKSQVCPADQTNEWLSENILSDSENCTNKYRSTMLKTHMNLPPILRPAP